MIIKVYSKDNTEEDFKNWDSILDDYINQPTDEMPSTTKEENTETEALTLVFVV